MYFFSFLLYIYNISFETNICYPAYSLIGLITKQLRIYTPTKFIHPEKIFRITMHPRTRRASQIVHNETAATKI